MMLEPAFTLEQIRRAFMHPLPGAEAQFRLAPEFRVRELLAPRPLVPKAAGALLLLYSNNGGLHFPLIQRASNPHDRHSGQISLPGGSQESSESIRETAFRETEEEIGVARDKIIFIGTLSPVYIPPSNFLVTPFVATVHQCPKFYYDANEVSRLYEVPLSFLIDPISFRYEELELQGMKVQVPLYQMGSVKVFGATAMILSEFQVLIKNCGRVPSDKQGSQPFT